MLGVKTGVMSIVVCKYRHTEYGNMEAYKKYFSLRNIVLITNKKLITIIVYSYLFISLQITIVNFSLLCDI